MSLLLTFFLGPIGLFYVSGLWAFFMLIFIIVGGIFTYGILALVGYIICLILSLTLVRKHNEALAESLAKKGA